MTKQEQFRKEVEAAVREAIARQDSGTVGMSADCLWQNTRIKQTDSSPKGTNAAWVARQVFNEVIACRPWSKFVYAA